MKESKKKINLSLFLLVLFYPILALFGLKGKLKDGNRGAYVALAFILGFYGYLYPPVGDMYRYAMDFELYSDVSFTQFLILAPLYNKDFLLPFLDWILAQLGLVNDWTRFFFIFLGSLLTFRIFYEVREESQIRNSKAAASLFLVYLLLMNINFILFRFGLAMCFFVYGYYLLLYKNIKMGYLWVGLAIFCHFGISPLLFPLVFSQILGYNGNKSVSVILMIMILFADIDVADQIIRKLPFSDSMVDYLSVYTSGFWKEEYLQEVSLNYKIFQVLNKVGYYALFFFYIKHHRPCKVSAFIDMMLAVMVILSPMKAMFGRFVIVLNFILAINFISIMFYEWRVIRFQYTKKIFLYIGIFITMVSIYAKRHELALSDEYLLLAPTVMIVNHSYDSHWIETNVDANGDFKR